MTDVYTKAMLSERVAGIEARSWIAFFKQYTEAHDPEAVWKRLEANLKTAADGGNRIDAERLRVLLDEMAGIMRGATRE